MRLIALVAICTALVCFGIDPAAAAVITVTTTAQEVDSDADCSLQEAIFSANFDAAIAVDPSNMSNAISTGCTAGSGADTIVLAAAATYQMSGIVQDPFNHLGPTATPLIFTVIEIQGNGAKLERVGGLDIRLFSVAPASFNWNSTDYGPGQGALSLYDVHVVGFRAHGGNGGLGGGGGMGAGGAIYLEGGTQFFERCTFEGNSATGGDGGAALGSVGGGGGGGGLGGDGGSVVAAAFGGGGGGGGARGNGGAATFSPAGSGGGGGGTANNGVDGLGADAIGGNGGFRCGGGGGDHGTAGSPTGLAGTCEGGAGGGGAGGDGGGGGAGGAAGYGGGGGGGGAEDDGSGGGVGGDGGAGGLGGGGGGGGAGGDTPGAGGAAGFGAGGGGAYTGAAAGTGGAFGGNGSTDASGGGGGGGAGLGGAIFASAAFVQARECTFFGNTTGTGAGQGGAGNGASHGQVFVLGGQFAGNFLTFSSGNSGDVVVSDATLYLEDSILANDVGGGADCKLFGAVPGDISFNVIEVNGSAPASPCTGTGNLFVDPQLEPLAPNGPGLTPTMAIPATSPAYDSAGPGFCGIPGYVEDQRTVTRPQSTSCDRGAYELALIDVTLDTVPAGLQIMGDGTPFTAPHVFSWALGSSHTIATSSPQDASGSSLVFLSWSDSGAISHSVAPIVDTAYTAEFFPVIPLLGGASLALLATLIAVAGLIGARRPG